MRRLYESKYPGIWRPELEVFRVLITPDGKHYLDIEFINDHSVKLGLTPFVVPGTYSNIWLYEDFEITLAAGYTWAAERFEGEPYGWVRHPGTGRRRHHGDHRSEYYQP
jgi:hypothetical protein